MSERFWEVTLRYRSKEYLVAHIPTTHITRSRLHDLMVAVFAKYTLTTEEIAFAHLRRNVKRHRSLINIQERYEDPNTIIIQDGSNWVHAIVRSPGDPVQDDLPPAPRTELVKDD